MLTGWRRNPQIVPPSIGITVHINSTAGNVLGRVIRRVFRTAIGDWAAELELDGKVRTEIFDHHPTVTLMGALRESGVDIADDVLAQGAEGEDVRSEGQ